MYGAEPRFNDLRFNDIPVITINICFPGKSYSKMYGAEPRFNDLRFYDIPGLTINLSFPGKSYSKMYGAESRFNDLRFNDIPVKIVKPGFCPIHFTIAFAGETNAYRYTGNIIKPGFHCNNNNNKKKMTRVISIYSKQIHTKENNTSYGMMAGEVKIVNNLSIAKSIHVTV